MYFYKEHNLLLTVYVDDFCLSEPSEKLDSRWKAIRESGLIIEDPEPPGLYLGCIHEFKQVEVDAPILDSYWLPTGEKVKKK